jgi:hypothetical protein
MVRFQVPTVANMKMIIAFWDVSPCSLVEVDRRFIGAYCLHHQDIALMLEAVCTSETSVYFSETHTALYILEGYHLQRKLSIM